MNFSNTLKSHLMALIDEMDSHHYDLHIPQKQSTRSA